MKTETQQAKRYETAWNKLFHELAPWKQQVVISEPFGRIANELAHEVATLAERGDKEILA